jgi:hypothetical protein
LCHLFGDLTQIQLHLQALPEVAKAILVEGAEVL